jgi:hypothetical protein
MGVHRERLAASKAHSRFVEGAKSAFQRMGRRVPGASEISPMNFGALPLSFAAPPMMEEAFGYNGALRFVVFGYSPRTRRFGHCDGGDDIPTEDDLWLKFLSHPFVASHLPEDRYPTLYGKSSRQASLQGVMEGEDGQKEGVVSVHYLLLDRDTRQLYICQRDQVIVFLSLAEPDEKDARRVFIDGLRMSSGDEDYRVPPPPELATQFFARLDERFKSLRLKGAS